MPSKATATFPHLSEEVSAGCQPTWQRCAFFLGKPVRGFTPASTTLQKWPRGWGWGCLSLSSGPLEVAGGRCRAATPESRRRAAPTAVCVTPSETEVWVPVLLLWQQREGSRGPRRAQPFKQGRVSSTLSSLTGPRSGRGEVTLRKSAVTQRKAGETVSGWSPLTHGRRPRSRKELQGAAGGTPHVTGATTSTHVRVKDLEAAAGTTEPMNTLLLLYSRNVEVGIRKLDQQARRRWLRTSSYFSLLRLAQSGSCTSTTKKESGRCSFKLSSLRNTERHHRKRIHIQYNAL
ncbi:uncharacterized protein LOC115275135 [Suricata suricatta]|uniref:uncharacterized protein LOC115275135 n=1 Tax=Suricata suricatta TaxID=37032 RepID=UPI0011555919|nr:uncharacterized protein LOC115275135 [Suricata suricatta]